MNVNTGSDALELLYATSASTPNASSTASVSDTATENANAFKEMYAQLVQEKIDSALDTMQEMAEKRLEEMQLATLTSLQPEVQMLRKFMPDGSIMITEMKDGKIVSRYRKKPHLMAVPDTNYAVPTTPDGMRLTATAQKMKMVQHFGIGDFLMGLM